MTVPAGWSISPLEQLLAEPLINGRSVPTLDGGFPVLRLTAARNGRIDLDEQKGGAWTVSEASPYLVRENDLMVVRGNGTLSLVGRGALVGNVGQPVAFPDTMIRARADTNRLDPRYLASVWNSDVVRRQLESVARTTAGIYKINQTHIRRVLLPVPRLSEQRRIVDILEDHLSRLDAAEAYLTDARKRLRLAHRSLLASAIPDAADYPSRWLSSTVREAGSIELGRQRHPDWHTGSNEHPYLRVANVFEDEIRTNDVKSMHWPVGTFEKFRLVPGDLLLNEGQTPDLLGRPALYRGDPPEVAFTNTLLRFKANATTLPEFALLVFRRHLHTGRFKREARITTNIAHLSAARLKSIEFPIVPIAEQRELVDRTDALMTANQQVKLTLDRASRRQWGLRRALVSAAFSGRLTGRSTDGEVVEEIAERAVAVS